MAAEGVNADIVQEDQPLSRLEPVRGTIIQLDHIGTCPLLNLSETIGNIHGGRMGCTTIKEQRIQQQQRQKRRTECQPSDEFHWTPAGE